MEEAKKRGLARGTDRRRSKGLKDEDMSIKRLREADSKGQRKTGG